MGILCVGSRGRSNGRWKLKSLHVVISGGNQSSSSRSNRKYLDRTVIDSTSHPRLKLPVGHAQLRGRHSKRPVTVHGCIRSRAHSETTRDETTIKACFGYATPGSAGGPHRLIPWHDLPRSPLVMVVSIASTRGYTSAHAAGRSSRIAVPGILRPVEEVKAGRQLDPR
jgi:hypothetical protein